MWDALVSLRAAIFPRGTPIIFTRPAIATGSRYLLGYGDECMSAISI